MLEASLAAYTAWLLWSNRNAVAHQESGKATISLWAQCLAYHDDQAMRLQSERDSTCISSSSRIWATSLPVCQVWVAPPCSYLKIHVDASVNGALGIAGMPTNKSRKKSAFVIRSASFQHRSGWNC